MADRRNPFLDEDDFFVPYSPYQEDDAFEDFLPDNEESLHEDIGCCAWGSTYGKAGTIHNRFVDGQWEECCTFG